MARLRVAIYGSLADVLAWFAQMNLEPTVAEDAHCHYVGFISATPPEDDTWDVVVDAAERQPASEEAGGFRK